MACDLCVYVCVRRGGVAHCCRRYPCLTCSVQSRRTHSRASKDHPSARLPRRALSRCLQYESSFFYQNLMAVCIETPVW